MTPGTTTWDYLERKPSWPYQQLFLKGQPLAANRLYQLSRAAEAPLAPEEITDAYALPLAAVREALAYGETNAAAVQADRALDESRIRKRLEEACHSTMCATPPRWPWQYLIPKPGSAYRQFVVKDRHVPAWSLYCDFACEREPYTLEEIAASWEIPMPAVLEALAYSSIHPPEIQEDWERDQAALESRRLTKLDDRNHG
jgi:hypothetical protein